MITMIIIRKRNLTEMNNVNNDFKVYEDLCTREETMVKTKNMVSHHMVSNQKVDNIKIKDIKIKDIKIKDIKTMVGINNNLHHMHSHIIMVIEDK